jgi:gliding motility-associated-like protein
MTSTQQNPSTIYSTHGIKTITLTETTANGCSATVSHTVDIETNPVAEFDFSTTCPGLPIQFNNRTSNVYGTIAGYTWQFGPGQSSTLTNPMHTYFNDGNYPVVLTAITTGGCQSDPKTHSIPIRTVKAYAGKDTLVFKNTPVQLRATGGISYKWSPATYLNNGNIVNPIASIPNDQLFQVEVMDERGCKSTDVVNVQVFIDDDIYVPSSFTPNNDGKNDLFRVIAPPGTVYVFEVYNRWGQRIFSTSDQQKGWDGKVKGMLQPSGVFVWFLKAKTRQGKQVEKKGTVMLVW